MVQKIRVIKFQRKLHPRVSLSSSFETRDVGHLLCYSVLLSEGGEGGTRVGSGRATVTVMSWEDHRSQRDLH